MTRLDSLGMAGRSRVDSRLRVGLVHGGMVESRLCARICCVKAAVSSKKKKVYLMNTRAVSAERSDLRPLVPPPAPRRYRPWPGAARVRRARRNHGRNSIGLVSAHHNRVHVRDSAVPHACLTPYAPGGIPNRYMPPRAPCAAGRVRKLASQLSRTTIDSYARLATCAMPRSSSSCEH